AFCFYRAATQSFTIDESATFLRYVDVPINEAFSSFTANNHVLLTLLMRASRWLLGRSELVLRIPALLGCALYLTSAYRLTETSIRRNWSRLVALMVLTLNPLVLDLLVAARGYSLALGFSMWALYLGWSDLKENRPRRLWWAGLCAGLAISANLVFAIPLCMLGLVLIPEYARQGRFWELIDGYAGPAAVICFVLLFLPLSKFSSDEFYFGVAKLSETTASLLGESLWQPFGGLFLIDALTQVAPRAREFFINTLSAGLLIVIGFSAVWLMTRRQRGMEALLLGFVLSISILSVATWVLMNKALGVLFPMTRTAVYILPLIGFAGALAADLSRTRIASMAFTSLTVLLATLYVSELRATYFSEWRSEAGMKRLMRRLVHDTRDRENGSAVTAGGSWDLEFSIRYYRVRYRAGWIRVLGVEERKSETPEYFFLGPDDRKLVDQLKLKVIEQDDTSGTLLARRT
ncbi:MAG TPA: hypothetical protein VEX68_03930, partial [Bryobacteraceae bacterium]|nr:hypothetical protein [Bryobacteraceae bacterium]